MIHGFWTNSAAIFCNQLTRDLMAGNDDFVSGQPYDNNLRGKYSYMINCSFYLNFFLWILSILLMFGTVDWTFLKFNNYLEIYKIKHFLKMELHILPSRRFNQEESYTICTQPLEVSGEEKELQRIMAFMKQRTGKASRKRQWK